VNITPRYKMAACYSITTDVYITTHRNYSYGTVPATLSCEGKNYRP